MYVPKVYINCFGTHRTNENCTKHITQLLELTLSRSLSLSVSGALCRCSIHIWLAIERYENFTVKSLPVSLLYIYVHGIAVVIKRTTHTHTERSNIAHLVGAHAHEPRSRSRARLNTKYCRMFVMHFQYLCMFSSFSICLDCENCECSLWLLEMAVSRCVSLSLCANVCCCKAS